MKILIVGLSVRAMAESAVHSGYPVVALDAFGDQDLRTLAEVHSLHHDLHASYSPLALYRASRQIDFDAVAYTSSLENHPEILRRLAGSRRIIGNPPSVIQSVRQWPTLFARLRRARFRVPDTMIAGGNRKISRGRRWLVKPLLSGGGHGISFLQGVKSPGSRFMLQEFVPGKPCSASFVANGQECVVLGITEQLIGTRPFGSHGFRYCGNILPLPEALNPETGKSVLEQVNRLAAFVTRQYGLTGVNGIDFILNEDHVCLTEVNPRYSASMELIEQAYGLPVFHLHVQSVLNGRLPGFKLEARLKRRGFSAKAILFAEQEACAPDTRNWQAEGIRDIPAAGEKLPRGGPICTILVSRPTYDETFTGLIRQAAVIKERVYG
jgi:predicted ATP-grasp superfamily ATP-dependent carboligase